MSAVNICPHCDKLFSTKYTLKTHVNTIHRRETTSSEPVETILSCGSARCSFQTKYPYDLKRHMGTCLFVVIDTEVEKKELEKNTEIAQKDAAILELREMLKEANQTISRLAEQAINRPTTSTNITTNFNTILCDRETYEERTHPDRIIAIAREKFEPYFWKGQRGVAQFALDHIVKTEDGKMIMVCTDPSRKRFRFMNADKKVIEDIDARNFTQTISVPIKTVCQEVFDTIVKRLDNQCDDETLSTFTRGFLSDKKDVAAEKFISIREIDNDDYNQQYKSELSTLLNI